MAEEEEDESKWYDNIIFIDIIVFFGSFLLTVVFFTLLEFLICLSRPIIKSVIFNLDIFKSIFNCYCSTYKNTKISILFFVFNLNKRI